jgi:membrane fusion protein, multidrug efflux system
VSDSSDSAVTQPPAQGLKRWLVPALTLLMAAGIVFLIAGNWKRWESDQAAQVTDDAYVQANVTPLSTKAAGLVASVAVSDFQRVRRGDLIVKLRDDDFRAQVQEAQAAVASGEGKLIDNQLQKELQDARITQADTGIRAAESEIAAAEAGIEAAKSAIANSQAGIEGANSQVVLTTQDRRRQDALIKTESTTPQKLQQAVANEAGARALFESRTSELNAAKAQLASRQADLARAHDVLRSKNAELEVQRRQRALLDSQELILRADLNAERASLSLSRINLGYTRIEAPEAGIVSEHKVLPGQLVSPGTQVISLVQGDVWVQANYKETQVGTIHPGDPAEMRVDAIPGVTFRGKVDQVSPATGSQFALLPPDNATGNFTKIVQRLAVKIVLDPAQENVGRLRPGLSVTATIHTNGAGR